MCELLQGVPSIAEESTSVAGQEHSNPIHQLSLGPSSMYASGVLYEPSAMQGPYGLSVRPYSMPKHMTLPMALPLMSHGAVTADQVTEVVGMGYSMENNNASSRNGMSFNMETSPRSGIERPVGMSYTMESSGSAAGQEKGPALSLGGSGSGSGLPKMPFSFNSWPGQGFRLPMMSGSPPNSNVVRPTAKVAAVTAAPVKMEDDSKDITQLNLGLSPPEPSQLTAKLLDPPSRHTSAFHVNSSFDTNSIQQGVNAISVV